MNGENHNFSRIEMFAITPSNLELPLFLDSNGVVQTNAIWNYSANVYAKNMNIDKIEFGNILACLCGINAVVDSCYDLRGTWLSESNNALVVDTATNAVSYFPVARLPLLHKIIFFHAHASVTKNKGTDTQVFMPDNVQLMFDDLESSFQFRFVNKQNLLKLTTNPNCVATPLILTAKREIDTRVDLSKTFMPIAANHF
jgi:hypothetical protein